MNKSKLLFLHKRFVVLDPTDTSITFSLKLIRDFKNNETAQFFVFKAGDTFGFMEADEKLIAESQCGELQYNSSTRTVGFESLNPTVSYILTCMNVPLLPTKVRVKIKRAKHLKYYELCF